MSQEWVKLQSVIKEIVDEVRSGRKAIAFLTTEKKHSIQIAFNDGDLVAVSYARKQGVEALESMHKEVDICRFRLQEGVVPPKKQQVTLDDLLRIFSSSLKTKPSASSPQKQQPQQFADADQREAIIAKISSYIGPVATMVYEESCKAQTVEEWIEQMTDVLPDLEQKRELVEFVHSLIG